MYADREENSLSELLKAEAFVPFIPVYREKCWIYKGSFHTSYWQNNNMDNLNTKKEFIKTN